MSGGNISSPDRRLVEDIEELLPEFESLERLTVAMSPGAEALMHIAASEARGA